MNFEALVARLHAGNAIVGGLVAGLDAERARWRPAPQKWSILEVVCHLADEERLDFRTRLDLTLHQPGTPWPGIDPVAWVTERDYQSRDLGEALDDFQHERQKSTIWLGSLQDPDWQASHEHPRLGRMRAGDLLAAWVVHDLLHVRQINALHHARARVDAGEFSADYAGPW